MTARIQYILKYDHPTMASLFEIVKITLSKDYPFLTKYNLLKPNSIIFKGDH